MKEHIKPEVGDVWINTKNNKKMYITGLGIHVYIVLILHLNKHI